MADSTCAATLVVEVDCAFFDADDDEDVDLLDFSVFQQAVETASPARRD